METTSRSCATAVVEPVGGWAGRPSSGEPKPEEGMERPHTVTVTTLQDTSTDPDEMLEILGSALAHVHARITREPPNRCVLVLTVETTDLWLAVLMAMNAVNATGYPPISVSAGPARPDRAERGG